MRKISTLACALALASLSWAGGPPTTPPTKKAPAKTSTAAPAAKKPATGTAAAAAKRKAPVVRTTWRNRQTAPTSDRYREIQNALVARGYLASEEATGTWGASSSEALKKFQSEQTLESTGKIDSLSLIALGLGPRHDSPAPKLVDGNVQPESGRN